MDTGKSLTITLLSILRDFVTRLTFDACKGTLRVCTYSLGACSGQLALINICCGTTQTVRHSLQDRTVSTAEKKIMMERKNGKMEGCIKYTWCYAKVHLNEWS